MNTRPLRRWRARRHAGFGLVELMVAMVLGMLLVAAVVHVLLGQRASQGVTDALSSIHARARFALYILERELRQAGYSGCANPVTMAPAVPADAPYGRLNILSVDTSVGSWRDFAQAVGEPRDDHVPSSASSASDVLRLGYVRDPGVRVVAPTAAAADALKVSGNPAGWEEGDQLLATDCRSADLFTVTDIDGTAIAHAATGGDGEGWNADAGLSKRYAGGARVLEPYAVIYYIRDSGEGTRTEPTLYRRRVAPDVRNSRALVKGIGHLTLRYGVDLDDNPGADGYVAAEAVPDWSAVVAVRVGFVAESARPMGSDGGRVLRIFDRRLTSLPDDGRLRRVFTTTVALRNRLP